MQVQSDYNSHCEGNWTKEGTVADKSALVWSTAVDISDIDMFFFSALSWVTVRLWSVNSVESELSQLKALCAPKFTTNSETNKLLETSDIKFIELYC